MGNIWKCCSSSEEPAELNKQLLTSALRVPSKFPILQNPRSGTRSVRIETDSPKYHHTEAEDFETESSESEEKNSFVAESTDPPILTATPPSSPPVSPSHSPNNRKSKSSGLRLLLANSSSGLETPSSPRFSSRRESDEQITKPLKRVQRHESFDAVYLNEHQKQKQSPSEIPKNLIFAVLEDGAVAKLIFEDLLFNKLLASEKSIVRGANLKEYREFMNTLSSLTPNVVILKHCLIYEEEKNKRMMKIYGVDIGHELKTNGFEGTILLQKESPQTDNQNNQIQHQDDTLEGAGLHFQYLLQFPCTSRQGNCITPQIEESLVNFITEARNSNDFHGSLIPPSAHSSWNSRPDSSFSFGYDRILENDENNH